MSKLLQNVCACSSAIAYSNSILSMLWFQ